MNINEIIMFLQFGLFLNVFAFISISIFQFIGLIRVGLMKGYELSIIAKKLANEYKFLKKKYEPVSYYIELFAIFIPFFFAYRMYHMIASWTNGALFIELPLIILSERIGILKQKYS